ncbi:phosphoenolpyruvate carboxykinase (ATP) [Paenibacillus cymbidii]|uniref:phosphoenolpyruvate carboxykinase (ATP) n=1 Tax=Paenibacillus cymbidii TaxID=1639034 RepID=UPI0010807656|nr:phosphoenolpyruvate carboxykinase (ATP) [Paenibacillus cymbidii]
MNNERVAGSKDDLLVDAQTVHRNLSVSRLYEQAIAGREAKLASSGALQVSTGSFTGRSPGDKYIVTDPSVADFIAWGDVNRPLAPNRFDRLYDKARQYMSGREVYVFEGYAGADPLHRVPVRVVNEFAWQNLFVRQLFLPRPEGETNPFAPEFTVIALPDLLAEPETDGTRSETFIVISFEKNIILIGGTHYAGEIKKSLFSVLNYKLPFEGILPMHCSANVGADGDVALFFGLSGTGKTTLSADPTRRLIGDDEHGWSDTGVYNFEGGCYAKCIGLSREKEPQIWDAIGYGTVLENVKLDALTGEADYASAEITENTRAAYAIDRISNAVVPGMAGHPGIILFLAADAFGVLPPIAKLTSEQAIYYFLSGYTSKLAGTERGVTEPAATFSACFGAPFMPLAPKKYAEMLGRNIARHGCRVYLVNTGWRGGAAGVGKRMELRYTRAMVTAAIEGTIEQASYSADPIFGLARPDHVPGVPDELLDPRHSWGNKNDYDVNARQLKERFERNFAKLSE